MNRRLLTAVCLAGAIPAFAFAQPADPCASSVLIDNYIDARDNDIPLLETLTPEHVAELIGHYQDLEAAIVGSLVEIPGGQAPGTTMRNDLNFQVEGGELGLQAQAGIINDLALTVIPAQSRNDYLQRTRDYIAALQGTAGMTFAERVDRSNRELTEQTLLADGCPHDLAGDYDEPPYLSP